MPNFTSLAGLNNLTVLNIGGNGLGSISDLSALTGLEMLWATNSGITDISALSSLSHLSYLDLGGNTITNLAPIDGLSGLQTLLVDSNYISDISVLDNKMQLNSVDLSDNWLDLGPGTPAGQVVADLQSRGVTVNTVGQHP